MEVGSFAGVVFEVSSAKVLTFDGFKRATKHRYEEHKIFGGVPKLESVGVELVEIQMTIKLVAGLGLKPLIEAEKLHELCQNATADYLTIGNTCVNATPFVIESVSEQVNFFDGSGNVLATTLNLNFKEYNATGDF